MGTVQSHQVHLHCGMSALSNFRTFSVLTQQPALAPSPHSRIWLLQVPQVNVLLWSLSPPPCLAYFIQVHTFLTSDQVIFPFQGWTVFCCMPVPHFIHRQGTVELFLPWAIMDAAAINNAVQASTWVSASSSFGYASSKTYIVWQRHG